MLDINYVIAAALLVFFFMCFPLLVQFFIRSKVKGKHLCVILEKGRPLIIRLLKIEGDDFVKEGKDKWMLKTNLMKPVDYPTTWPRILHGFQMTVWCSLLARGNGTPLDWENPPEGALSSKEIPVILDPHWLMNLVKGVGEEGGTKSKLERMMLFVAVGASIISMILVFYVIVKMGGIQQSIDALRSLTY